MTPTRRRRRAWPAVHGVAHKCTRKRVIGHRFSCFGGMSFAREESRRPISRTWLQNVYQWAKVENPTRDDRRPGDDGLYYIVSYTYRLRYRSTPIALIYIVYRLIAIQQVLVRLQWV